MRNDDMPCGNCDCGTYSYTPVMNGLATFGNCASVKDALKIAPRCKIEPEHVCFGARDWIVSAGLPLSDADRTAIIKACTE